VKDSGCSLTGGTPSEIWLEVKVKVKVKVKKVKVRLITGHERPEGE
jgi:hypothetical protein